jgi:hypothetical protein
MKPAASSTPPSTHMMRRFIALSFLVDDGSTSGAERCSFKPKLIGGLR